MFLQRSALSLAMVLLLLVPSSVFAVEYGGIGGRPAYPDPSNPRTKSIFVFTLEPGQTIENGVRVINNTEEKKTLMVYAVDSVVSSGGAFACAQFNDQKKDVGSWIKLAKNEVTLEPLTNEVVPFTISAPATVDVGEHNGCIVIQEKKATTTGQRKQGINLTFRTGLRVAVLIPGEINRKLEIAGFDFSQRPEGGYLAKPRVRNLGNVSIDADVKVWVDYFFGPNLTVKGGQYTILRGQESEWNFKIDKPFWGGWYKTYLTVAYDPHKEAVVGKESGKGLEVLSTSPVYFFASPQPLALLIEIVVLLLIVVVIFRIWLWYKRRRWIEKEWVEYQVQSGDDLKALAEKFDVSWKLLARVNNIKPPYTLESGIRIKVPPYNHD